MKQRALYGKNLGRYLKVYVSKLAVLCMDMCLECY
jgi:hypothetical protein